MEKDWRLVLVEGAKEKWGFFQDYLTDPISKAAAVMFMIRVLQPPGDGVAIFLQFLSWHYYPYQSHAPRPQHPPLLSPYRNSCTNGYTLGYCNALAIDPFPSRFRLENAVYE